MRKAVFCTTKNRERAEKIVEELRSEGFRYEDVSVLLPDTQGTTEFAHEKHTKAPEGASVGGVSGGVVGGVLGLLAGIGALAIPGLGPFIAAGPIMAALSGAAVGAGVGGIAGALIGMGIPEIEAKRYEHKVRGGHVLISVHCADDDQVGQVMGVFKHFRADDISTAIEGAPPSAPVGPDATRNVPRR